MGDSNYRKRSFRRTTVHITWGLAVLLPAGCSDSMSSAEKNAREALRSMGAMTVLGVDQIHVGTVTMTVPSVQDKMEEAIPHVGNLPYLTHLELTSTNLTDEHMKVVGKLKRLTSLVLSKTQITDTGLKAISGLPIDTLYVDGTKITGASMDVVGGMSSLKILDISRTDAISNIKPLAKLKNLEWLVLEDAKIDASVVDIVKDLPAIGRFTIKNSTISAEDLGKLKSAKPSLMIDHGAASAAAAAPPSADDQPAEPAPTE